MNIQDEENSVTMVDVLQDVNELEDDVNAVLGACDENNCTYNKGYIRQALYSCKTCCSSDTRAALCFACSLHCHEGHDLIELYTKRHVRCDCGNSKFENKKCNLEPNKESLNNENKYNQNYNGLYCICNRPYLDPETDEDENQEMLQCIICEDWYHSKHLENIESRPKDNEYSEMICNGCMEKHQFLWHYAPSHSVTKDNVKEQITSSEQAVEVSEVKKDCTLPKTDISKINTKSCCFWIEGWRSALCSCENCKKVYKESEVMFLLDPLDSIQVYEEGSKANGESLIEKGMKALASLDHVHQLNAIKEYNIMKDNLKEYLKKFAENKKVVREEDILEFFDKLGAKKRAKVEVQSYCR